jgi:hypothetical protein
LHFNNKLIDFDEDGIEGEGTLTHPPSTFVKNNVVLYKIHLQKELLILVALLFDDN